MNKSLMNFSLINFRGRVLPTNAKIAHAMSSSIGAVVASMFLVFALASSIGCSPGQSDGDSMTTPPNDMAIQTPSAAVSATGAKNQAPTESEFASIADIQRDGEGNMIAVDLRGRELRDSDLVLLADQRMVKSLKLNGDKIEKLSPNMSFLVTLMPNLKVLAVDGIGLPSDFLTQFQRPTKFVEFYASNAMIGDDDGANISSMTSLEKLRLSKNAIGSKTAASIATLGELVELDVSGCPLMGDEEAIEIAKLEKLTKLNLYDTAIGDRGVAALSKMPSLTWLNLDKTPITDDAVKSISSLPALKWLHLGSTAITNAAAESLATMKSLETLIVTRTEMTQVGVDKIAAALPDVDIQLQYEPK